MTPQAKKWAIKKRNKANREKLVAFRIANGLCYLCGNELPKGYKLKGCPSCRVKAKMTEEEKASKARRYSAYKALGRCLYHPDREAVNEKNLCDYCLEKSSEASMAWFRKNRAVALAKGLCSVCFKNKPETGKMCEPCKAKKRARQARLAAKKKLDASRKIA